MDTVTAVIFTLFVTTICSATIAAVEHLQLPHKYQRLPSCKDKVERRGHSAHNVAKQLSTSSSTNYLRPKTNDFGFTRTRRLGPRFCAPDPALLCVIFMISRHTATVYFHMKSGRAYARGAAFFFVSNATRFAFPTARPDRVPLVLFDFAGAPGLASCSGAWHVKAAKVTCAQSSLLAQLTSSQNIAPTLPQPPTSVRLGLHETFSTRVEFNPG